MKTTLNQNNLSDSLLSSKSSDLQARNLNRCQLAISSSDVVRVVFEESLALIDESGQKLDDVVVAVEQGENGAFVVYQYSQDENRLLRVQSRVYRNLETDMELRRIKVQDRNKMLRLTVSEYLCKVFLLCLQGKEGWRYKVEYTRTLDDLLISEGSNIILLRKLATNNLFGQFKCQIINHDGKLCVCEYNVEKGDNYSVRVRRIVSSDEGQEEMNTVMSREGRIILHQWASSDCCLVSTEPRVEPDAVMAKSTSDVDLISFKPEIDADQNAYFAKKNELIQLMTVFLRDQPDVEDMIADLLKNLLFEKPNDVLDFADRFLSEFVAVESLSEDSGWAGTELQERTKEKISDTTLPNAEQCE